MRTLVIAAALVVCAPGYPAAQSRPPVAIQPRGDARPDDAGAAAAAIQAIVQADYTNAATLLKPLVDNWTGRVSEAAAFFLATLYENGLGVPQDLPRACALYSRIEGGGGPFARLAGPLARAQFERLGPDRADECVLLASVGINHGFAPARFMLDADSWVAVDLSSKDHSVVATVSARGEEKTSPLQAALNSGSIFLPLEHTAVEWPRGSGSHRHFLEVAAWVPLPDSSWQLAWSLSEIAGKDIVSVAEGTLTTIAGTAPPSDVSVELRDLVSLDVNEAGSIEFAVLDAAEARRERVPDVAERREVQDELRKRRAADEKVNWKRRSDPDRSPTFAYTDARACGLLWLSGWSPERTESIAVNADWEFLKAQAATRTYDLASLPAEIDVVVKVFDRPQRDWSVCSDVTAREQGERQETWRAVSGTLHIELPRSTDQGTNRYRASIRIDDAEFVGPGGANSRSSRPITVSAVAVPSPIQ